MFVCLSLYIYSLSFPSHSFLVFFSDKETWSFLASQFNGDSALEALRSQLGLDSQIILDKIQARLKELPQVLFFLSPSLRFFLFSPLSFPPSLKPPTSLSYPKRSPLLVMSPPPLLFLLLLPLPFPPLLLPRFLLWSLVEGPMIFLGMTIPLVILLGCIFFSFFFFLFSFFFFLFSFFFFLFSFFFFLFSFFFFLFSFFFFLFSFFFFLFSFFFFLFSFFFFLFSFFLLL